MAYDPMGVKSLNARVNGAVLDEKRIRLAKNEVARAQREIQRVQIAANGLALQLRTGSYGPGGPVEHALQATRDWIVSLVECQAYIAETLGAFDAFFRVKIRNERAADYGLNRARTDLGIK